MCHIWIGPTVASSARDEASGASHATSVRALQRELAQAQQAMEGTTSIMKALALARDLVLYVL